MAYRQPGVKVTQEFVNALPALAAFSLPNVTIGPAYQVVTDESAGAYDALQVTLDFPNQIVGTIIDLTDNTSDLVNFPVTINFKNTVIRFLNQAGIGVVNSYDLNQFTDATSNIFQDVLPGDVIVVTGSLNGNDGSYTVREKVTNNALKTNETFAAAETGLTYSVRRNIQATIGTINIPTSTIGVVLAQAGVTLPASLTYDHAIFGVVPIISADVYLTYRALRLELSAGLTEVKRTAELQALFGVDQIVPENPLAYAAFLALNNSATPTNILALGSSFIGDDGTGGDELVAYSNAFDIVALEDTMYAISVLTQLTSVHSALKSHVLTLSAPDKKRERAGIINRKIVLTSVVSDEKTTTGGLNGISGSGPTFTSFADVNASFITDGVVPGQYLNVSAPSLVIGRYKIASVNSQTSLTLVTATAPTSADATVTYTIDRDLSKNEQASTMAAYASSLATRRIVMTWPDVVKIPVGSTVRKLPGYFLNPAVGALTTGLPTQQGFTNLSVAVYSGVVHSTKYFDNDQLNLLAAGGVMIFVQDVIDVTALYIRHQLTTDTSAIKFQEYSVTKNVDFIAKFIRDNHKQFIGRYNIVESTLDDLKANANGLLTFLKDNTRLPKIGGVIRSGKLVELTQDPVNIDTVIERYQLDIPIPLNNLDITIVV